MKKSQVLFFITFICILFISILIVFNQKDNQNSISNSNEESVDERLTKGSGLVGYGMYGKDNKIIDNGRDLEGISNMEINSKISLTNYINDDRKYKILVMNNFRQVQFEAKGNKNKSHDFFAKANTIVDTEILNEIDADTKEVAYLAIKDPDLLIEKLDLDIASSVQRVLSLRYGLENETVPYYHYESVAPLKTGYEGPIDNVFISETEELTALMSAESGQEVYLTVGNPTDEVMDYVLVSFLDWEQVPLINEEEVLYVTVNPNEKKIFQLRLPETDKKKNYQVLAFPFPYKTSLENFESHTVEGSFRTVIQPK